MAKQRQVIGENPLDALIQPNGHAVATIDERQPTQKKHPSKKQRITVQISVDVIERIKNAVYWTPGLTLASLAEEAFSQIVDELEEKKGSPFPHRKEELKTGRPIS